MPLLRVARIPVRVHASFLLLVAFVLVAALASHENALVALAWLVLLFGCVVAHELSHSLVARHYGIEVREIELLPIGGVSRISQIPDDPAQELAIAAAGPIASVGVGLIAGAIGLLAGASVWPPRLGLVVTANEFLWINLLLAAFNLLPAFPLDGGRIYRAWLERRYDRATATRLAAHTGRVLALGMAAVGFFFDLWLMLIAAFVYLGSGAEELATLVHVGLSGRTVDDVMVAADETSTVEAVPASELVRLVPPAHPGDPLEDIVLSGDLRSRVVVADGRVVGLVSHDDLVRVLRESVAAGDLLAG